MPWRANTTVSLRQELVQLAACQTVALSELCRRYRISRKTAYKWLRRYRQAGPAGLTDQSRRPRHPVGQTAPPLEAAVVALRRTHPAWGARKLRAALAGPRVGACPGREHGDGDPPPAHPHRAGGRGAGAVAALRTAGPQ